MLIFAYKIHNYKEINQDKYHKTQCFKVMFKCDSRMYYVGQGNHYAYELECKESNDIEIIHLSNRGKEHFYRKVINGGSSYEKSGLPENVGFHWREWYKNYKNGTLDETYRSLLLDPKDMDKAVEFDTKYFLDNFKVQDNRTISEIRFVGDHPYIAYHS